jgi:hypothetical protein
MPSALLFDDLVGTRKQRRRYRQRGPAYLGVPRGIEGIVSWATRLLDLGCFIHQSQIL